MNQPDVLGRRWEKRNRPRRLVLMTLGDVRASKKKTITQLFLPLGTKMPPQL